MSCLMQCKLTLGIVFRIKVCVSTNLYVDRNLTGLCSRALIILGHLRREIVVEETVRLRL